MAGSLYGHFDVNGFWRIHCKIRFDDEVDPRPDIIDLVIDSGAEISILSPDDAEKLGKGYDTLPTNNQRSIGNSGKCNSRILIGASFVFECPGEDREIIETLSELRVPDPNSWARPYSLLGLDILNKYRIIVDYRDKKVILKLKKPISRPLIAKIDFHKN